MSSEKIGSKIEKKRPIVNKIIYKFRTIPKGSIAMSILTKLNKGNTATSRRDRSLCRTRYTQGSSPPPKGVAQRVFLHNIAYLRHARWVVWSIIFYIAIDTFGVR